MCTVTFIPKGEDEFFLTSNRDENATRSPENITFSEELGKQMLFPRDTNAGGSWIAASSENKVVCLLNGAFEKHHHLPPYKRSRGLMVLDFFQYAEAGDFFERYDFEGIEPFTMIIFSNRSLYEFRWDERDRHLKKLDPKGNYIWSSSTLYDQSIREKRERWFVEWLHERKEFGLEEVLDFHQNAGDGDPWNDVIMNRNGLVQTVSITNIIKQTDRIEMLYHDLVNAQLKQAQIRLQGEVVGTN